MISGHVLIQCKADEVRTSVHNVEYGDASLATRWGVLWLSVVVHSVTAARRRDSGCCPIASTECFACRRTQGAYMGICRLDVSPDKLHRSGGIGSFGVGLIPPHAY